MQAPIVVVENPPAMQPVQMQQTQMGGGNVGVQPTFQMYSHELHCGSCGHTCSTKVRAESGTFAWLMCLLLCCLGCWLGCCIIPFYMDGCLDYYHTCGNCNKLIAVKK